MRYRLFFSETDKRMIVDRMLTKRRAGEFHGIWVKANGVNVRYQLYDSPVLITWHKAAELVGVAPTGRRLVSKVTLTPMPIIEERRRKRHEQSERRKEYLRAVGRTEPGTEATA